MPVTVDTSLPLHDDRETTWDGETAKAAMAAACGGRGEALDPVCMGKGFLWRDPDADDTTMGAYKFPVANVFGNSRHLVWSGVVAAAGALAGARSETTIPESDQAEMRSALNVIYGRFAKKFGDDSIVPPWDRESETAAAGTPNQSDTAVSDGASISEDQSENESDDGSGTDIRCACDGCQCEGSKEEESSEDTYDIVIRASAADGDEWRPPREWFNDPGLEEPTPLTVDPDGRIYGHLAQFGQRHIGADGHDIFPPKDPDGLYRAFRQRTILTDKEPVAVGVLTMDTGHAEMGIGAAAAIEHYDHTGAMVAAINIGETSRGGSGGMIWISGAILPGIDVDQRLRLSLSGVSGDWRQMKSRGPLELVAALAVNVPGFPVPARDVQDGRELALVAAGAILPASASAVSGAVDTDALAEAVVKKWAARQDQIAADLARSQRSATAHSVLAGCVTASRARSAKAALAASLTGASFEGGRESLVAAPTDAEAGWVDRPGTNWVEQAGGLPKMIKDVAKHLMVKGFTQSHAIATAINVVKKWCANPDSLNFPGNQQGTPATIAQGCVAVAEWEALRAKARAT